MELLKSLAADLPPELWPFAAGLAVKAAAVYLRSRGYNLVVLNGLLDFLRKIPPATPPPPPPAAA